MSKEIKYTDVVPNSIVTRYKEDNIQYLLDQVARLTAENAMLKEKWSAPKQPEPEQEPVAWMWEEEGDEGCVETMIDINKPRVNMYRENIRPLYLAPPKREPLSDRQIKILYGRDASDMDNQEYIWGFRDAEKHHGIGVDNE